MQNKNTIQNLSPVGLSSTKSYAQQLTEFHESILKKLGTEYPIRTTEIGNEVLSYINLLRKMRPNDKSITIL